MLSINRRKKELKKIKEYEREIALLNAKKTGLSLKIAQMELNDMVQQTPNNNKIFELEKCFEEFGLVVHKNDHEVHITDIQRPERYIYINTKWLYVVCKGVVPLDQLELINKYAKLIAD